MINFEELVSRQKASLPLAGSSCIFPDYEGYSLANIPHSICQWLGIPGMGEQQLALTYPLTTNKYDQVILLVVDGLGWLRLQQWMQTYPGEFTVWNQLLKQDRLVPLTSITPSTTCAALTTLNTGRAPAAHGNLAYELWLKEFGVVANMILHTPMGYRGEAGSLRKYGFKPAEFLPFTTMDSHLISNGISVDAIHPAAISHTSLTTMLFPSAKLRSFYSLGDLWYQLRDAMQNKKETPSYIFAYWSEVDELSHLYGPDDWRVLSAFRDFTRHLTDLWKNPVKAGTDKSLLVITADHGFQATPLNEAFNLKWHREFMNCLVISPTGENRLPFLYIKPGKGDQISTYLEKTWPAKFKQFSAVEFLSSGLMGSKDIYEKTAERLGDMVIVALDDAYWWWSGREDHLLGRHGGLSQHEMLVPLAFLEF